jgi:hypothetical protein
MSQIQSLLESANPYRSLQSDAARLAKKWGKTGLLEGLGDTDRNNMAMLLENQAKQLVTETSNVGGGSGFGAFSTGNGAEWAGIALPLVRKVFAQIAAKEFVSVQPMNLPSGLVFFLDFQYGNSKNPFTQNASLYGGTNNSGSQYPFQTNAAEGGLYGAGRFTYSTNQFSASIPYTASATNSSVFGTAAVAASTGSFVSASWSELNFDSAYSASVASGTIYKLTISASQLSGFDPDAVRGFIPLSGSLTNASVLPQFTTYTYTSAGAGSIQFFVTSSANFTALAAAGGGANSMIIYYNKATALGGSAAGTGNYNVGDFEDGNTSYAVPNSLSSTVSPANIVLPEINIQMQSQAITAKTKKLKAVWTPEFAQDLNAYQNIDAEAELTNMLSEYISMEIDLEILDMLIEDASAGTEYWSVLNNTSITSITAGPTTNTNAGFYNTQGQWFQTLGTKIQKLSNKIHQLTLRGGANFMVISPTIATVIESIPGFASSNNGEADQMEYAFGVQKAGTFNGRYKVYKNPYMTENTILLGFRGTQFLEAGAVFAPYVPLIMTPLVYDPNTFTPRKGIMTRYAKKMLRPEFYAKIYVNGLTTL